MENNITENIVEYKTIILDKNIILDKISEEEKIIIYKHIRSGINRKYREENRDQLLEKYNKKIACAICGRVLDYSNMSKHRRTKKCMKAKQELENNQTQNNQTEINNQNDEYADNDFSEEYISN